MEAAETQNQDKDKNFPTEPEQLNPAAVAPTVAFLLKKAHLATQKTLEETLSKFNLTRAQWDVLRQLWGQDGLSQRTIQENLGIESATLTGIVDGLVKRGLVKRQLSIEDARVKELYLTDEGRELGQRRIAEVVTPINARLTAGFSIAEIETLKNYLARIIDNLE
jgi:DNA-binding MarR family transcriptional regulator